MGQHKIYPNPERLNNCTNIVILLHVFIFPAGLANFLRQPFVLVTGIVQSTATLTRQPLLVCHTFSNFKNYRYSLLFSL